MGLVSGLIEKIESLDEESRNLSLSLFKVGATLHSQSPVDEYTGFARLISTCTLPATIQLVLETMENYSNLDVNNFSNVVLKSGVFKSLVEILSSKKIDGLNFHFPIIHFFQKIQDYLILFLFQQS